MASTEHDQRDVEAAKAAYERLYPKARIKFCAQGSIEFNLLETARIARLMAEGKWPEIDFDLIEARACMAQYWKERGHSTYELEARTGAADHTLVTEVAMFAIKRTRASLDGGRS